MIVPKMLSRFGKLGSAVIVLMLLILASPAVPAEPRFMAVESIWGIWRTTGPFRIAECEQFNNVMREAVRLTLARMDPPVELAVVVPGLYAGGQEGLFVMACVEIVEKTTAGSAKR
jgi:hypothetical protein